MLGTHWPTVQRCGTHYIYYILYSLTIVYCTLYVIHNVQRCDLQVLGTLITEWAAGRQRCEQLLASREAALQVTWVVYAGYACARVHTSTQLLGSRGAAPSGHADSVQVTLMQIMHARARAQAHVQASQAAAGQQGGRASWSCTQHVCTCTRMLAHIECTHRVHFIRTFYPERGILAPKTGSQMPDDRSYSQHWLCYVILAPKTGPQTTVHLVLDPVGSQRRLMTISK